MRRLVTTVAMLTSLAALAGCSDISAQLAGPQSSEPLSSGESQPLPPPTSDAAEPEATPTEGVDAEPEGEADAAQPSAAFRIVNWGSVDGLVSVVVVNRSQRTLSRAVAVLIARDANGALLGSAADAAPGGKCCTVVDLRPGGAYGFYFDLGPDAARVTSVELAYEEISWATAEPPAPAPINAEPVGVEAGAEGAVVVADVTTPEAAVAQAVVQAYLVGADGAFLAVVSGRWKCLAAGGTRRINMQLFHPVPEGTVVHSMVAYPGIDEPGSTGASCPA